MSDEYVMDLLWSGALRIRLFALASYILCPFHGFSIIHGQSVRTNSFHGQTLTNRPFMNTTSCLLGGIEFSPYFLSSLLLFVN